MSLQHRSIARFPLRAFESFLSDHDLLQGENNEEDPNQWSAETFRKAVALKLSRKQCQTIGSFLMQPMPTLVVILDPLCTYHQCEDLKHVIAEECAPKARTAFKLWTDRPGFLQTKVASLDAHLRGGIRKGTLTEIVGSPATGKTQLALQMALDTPTIFIDTENKVRLERLQEIGRARGRHTDEFLQNVTVHSPSNMEEFKAVLGSLEDELLTRPVGLLVVDSIAAPARREYEDPAEQMVAVLGVAQTLKRIADQYRIGVLLINQVSTTFGDQPKAALGTYWYHCVSTRIVLEHKEPRLPLRGAMVAKSNFVGPTKSPIPFHVTEVGLVDIDEMA